MPHSEYRSTALDRTFAPAQTLAVVGPVSGLEVDAARAMLTAAEAVSPTSRIRVDARADRRHWEYRTDIASGTAVTSRPDLATDDLGELMSRVLRRDGERAPVEIVLCGDYAVVHYSHGVGDGQMGVTMVGAAASDPGFAMARSMAPSLPGNATWAAFRRHFSASPRALRDVWRLRAHHKRNASAPDDHESKRIEDWESSKTTRTAYMSPERVAELRAWSTEHAPGSTGASVSVALVVAALRAEGVDLAEHVMILFNCRRYLDEKDRAGHGNFAIGIPVLLPTRPTPVDVATVMRDVIESGWPIAVLALADAKAALTGHRTAAPAAPERVVTVRNRPRLAVSDLGTLRMYDHLTWLDDGRPRQMTAALEPDGPEGISILISQVQGGRTYSASFCAGMIDADTVDRALLRVCSDPVGVLREGA